MKNRAVSLLFIAALAWICGASLAKDAADARLAIRTKQFSEAVRLLERDARSGSPDASYLLGLARWNGIGVSSDRDGARAELRRAAEAGHAPAAYALVALLAAGTPAEITEANVWLGRSAKAGYSPAVALLAAHALPLADARTTTAAAPDLRREFARTAARRDDAVLLAAVMTRELATGRGEFGRTLLFDAAEAGADDGARVLLSAGAAVDATDDYGETPLMLAVKHEEVATTRRLIGAGAKANSADKAGRTPLFRAAIADRADQVKLLLAAGAEVDHADAQGATAVDLAARNQSAAALAALRDAGGHAAMPSVLAPRGASGIDATSVGQLYRGWPPIAVAASRDDAADVTRRIAAGEPVDALNPDGSTALDIALGTRSFRAARALIDGGASLVRTTPGGVDTLERVVFSADADLFEAAKARVGGGLKSRGTVLLAAAARRGDVPVARALLASGTSPTEGDAQRMTPLMYASRAGDAEMIKLLLVRGAPTDARDVRGRSALWYAAAAGNGAAVGLLLDAGAAAEVADRDGATPLVAAIRASAPKAVERILAADGRVDAAEPGRAQPLRVAVEQRQAGMLALILARKPKIDAVDDYGDTALMVAARNGDLAMSEQLLAAGANARLRNRERATAAELAEARGFTALEKRLRE